MQDFTLGSPGLVIRSSLSHVHSCLGIGYHVVLVVGTLASWVLNLLFMHNASAWRVPLMNKAFRVNIYSH